MLSPHNDSLRSVSLRFFAAFVCLLIATEAATAADDPNQQLFQALGRNDCTVVRLWPGELGPGETKPRFTDGVIKTPEGALVFRPVVQAEMIIIPPPAGIRSTGVTALFCPGGGYGALETTTIAQGSKWLNSMGATAVLLKYRIPRRSPDDPPYHLPLIDAQRALGLLRSRADEWKLDRSRIGIFGFSAGGHLAAMASNHHAKRRYQPIDEHDRVSCRPDFCCLFYPAYLTNPILELKPDPALDQAHITPERTPPTFITVVRSDKFTVGCASYFAALRQAKVPAELHVWSSGGHGGLFDRYPLVGWGYEGLRFLRDHKVLDDDAVASGRKWIEQEEARLRSDSKNLRLDTNGAARKAPGFAAIAAKSTPADALPDDRLTSGDADARKLLGPGVPIIRLWPNGTRDDDPLATGGAQTADKEQNTHPQAATGGLRVAEVTRPTLAVLRPEKPDGRAVIIFPGGGYRFLSHAHEGIDVARHFNRQGITAFVLKYRVPKRDGVPVALQDAQRAVSLVRSRAAEFGIDPEWIGLIGFSAGGNLAAQTCHLFTERSYTPLDAHDKASCRPNFALLIYPGGLIDAEGKLDPQFAKPQRNQTPPIYLAVAADDKLIDGILPYMLALREARVPTALHVYERGGHGQGLREQVYPFSTWTFTAGRWLDDLTIGKPE